MLFHTRIMTDKRTRWEEAGRWGTHKEYLAWRKHMRGRTTFAHQLNFAHVATDMIARLEEERVQEFEEGKVPEAGDQVS